MLSINHLAIAACAPENLAVFYESVLGLRRLRVARDEAGVTSVWLELDAQAVLMIERATDPAREARLQDPRETATDAKAPRVPDASTPDMSKKHANDYEHKQPGWHAVLLTIDANERTTWLARLAAHGVRVEHQTAYSLYFFDPEGNRVGLSSFHAQDYLARQSQ